MEGSLGRIGQLKGADGACYVFASCLSFFFSSRSLQVKNVTVAVFRSGWRGTRTWLQPSDGEIGNPVREILETEGKKKKKKCTQMMCGHLLLHARFRSSGPRGGRIVLSDCLTFTRVKKNEEPIVELGLTTRTKVGFGEEGTMAKERFGVSGFWTGASVGLIVEGLNLVLPQPHGTSTTQWRLQPAATVKNLDSFLLFPSRQRQRSTNCSETTLVEAKLAGGGNYTPSGKDNSKAAEDILGGRADGSSCTRRSMMSRRG